MKQTTTQRISPETIRASKRYIKAINKFMNKGENGNLITPQNWSFDGLVGSAFDDAIKYLER